MATVPPICIDVGGDGSVKLYTYDLTTANNDGAPIEAPQWADRTAAITSVAYGGATAAIEGSNDGFIWVVLGDPQGVALAKTADTIKTVAELTRFVRPRLTTPGTAAAVRVSILCRRSLMPRG